MSRVIELALLQIKGLVKGFVQNQKNLFAQSNKLREAG